jgi:chemotaxis response regulator CheB
LFDSVADCFGSETSGILLTGGADDAVVSLGAI